MQDSNSLWISWQLYPQAAARAAISPLPPLFQAQANTLLDQLGQPSVLFPRLGIPFPSWAALLSHGGWRQRLYEQRQGLSELGVNSAVASVGNVKFYPAVGLGAAGIYSGWHRVYGVWLAGMARTLTIADHFYELRVFSLGRSVDRTWRIELRSAVPDGSVPARLQTATADRRLAENGKQRRRCWNCL